MKSDFPNASNEFKRLNPHLFPNLAGVGPVVAAQHQPNPGRALEQDEEARSPWTSEQVETLKNYYFQHTTAESFSVTEIAAMISKTEAAIYLKASRMGFTNTRIDKRPRSIPSQRLLQAQRVEAFNSLSKEEQHRIISERQSEIIKKFGHPKGMLGKHHTQAAKDAVSKFHSGKAIPREVVLKRCKTVVERYGTMAISKRGSWKAGWREIGGVKIYARSRWEANYGRYLEFLKTAGEIESWEHEPETFWFDDVKRGCVSYLPDFRVKFPSGKIEYHEVKGWMDARSKTKIKRMAKYHPTVVLRVIDKSWFKSNSRNLSGMLKGWETNSSTFTEIKPESP